MVARRASVLLEGTVDGQPYAFVSGLEAELEHEAQFTIGGDAANITINIDPTTWFKDASGARLDPSDAAQRAAIEANIRASFSAFQDDDDDGAEDHHDGPSADAGDHSGPGSGDAGDDHGGSGSPDGGDDHGGSPGTDGGTDGGGSDGGHH